MDEGECKLRLLVSLWMFKTERHHEYQRKKKNTHSYLCTEVFTGLKFKISAVRCPFFRCSLSPSVHTRHNNKLGINSHGPENTTAFDPNNQFGKALFKYLKPSATDEKYSIKGKGTFDFRVSFVPRNLSNQD